MVNVIYWIWGELHGANFPSASLLRHKPLLGEEEEEEEEEENVEKEEEKKGEEKEEEEKLWPESRKWDQTRKETRPRFQWEQTMSWRKEQERGEGRTKVETFQKYKSLSSGCGLHLLNT